MIVNAQAIVLQPIPATVASLPNTCFFANPGLQYKRFDCNIKLPFILIGFKFDMNMMSESNC